MFIRLGTLYRICISLKRKYPSLARVNISPETEIFLLQFRKKANLIWNKWTVHFLRDAIFVDNTVKKFFIDIAAEKNRMLESNTDCMCICCDVYIAVL
jgi:hypothetical protein